MNLLVAIIGPTGVGKSGLGLRLARKFDGEIVSADSRQVYCGMDIGTAKPSREELFQVPHHLIDVINPDEEFSLAQYQQGAYQTIDDIQKRGQIPFLVGGSGLYVWAVIEGWQVPAVPPDHALRRDLELMVDTIGVEGLYGELLRVDPESAEKIDPRNARRIIRALEVAQKAGKDSSPQRGKQAPPYQTYIIGLTADRSILYQRIDQRVDALVAAGLVAEVEKLRQIGYDFTLPAMSSIGYRQINQFLKGEMTLVEATDRIKTETHRLARHQNAWFRKDDARIHWFDIAGNPSVEIEAALANFITKHREQEKGRL
ncbi:tRNA (adenosine(37)-N6)-dimethylallyltransferase MiaA [Chloroflexota bacterium]